MTVKFDSYDVKSIEFMCKMNILWWLEVYEPADWRNNGPYLTIDFEREKEWFFDMGPMEYRHGGNTDLWNVGIAIGEDEFYWLYRFDPDAVPNGFDETNWNQEEFELMIRDFMSKGELDALHEALSTTKHNWRKRPPVLEGVYYVFQQPGYVRGKKY